MSDIKLACDVVEQVKTICDKHGNNAGELINILHEAQHLHGYLPEEMQRIIASKLRIPVSKVYGLSRNWNKSFPPFKRGCDVSGTRYVTHLLWGRIPTSHKPLPRQIPHRMQ